MNDVRNSNKCHFCGKDDENTSVKHDKDRDIYEINCVDCVVYKITYLALKIVEEERENRNAIISFVKNNPGIVIDRDNIRSIIAKHKK